MRVTWSDADEKRPQSLAPESNAEIGSTRATKVVQPMDTRGASIEQDGHSCGACTYEGGLDMEIKLGMKYQDQLRRLLTMSRLAES